MHEEMSNRKEKDIRPGMDKDETQVFGHDTPIATKTTSAPTKIKGITKKTLRLRARGVVSF